MEEQVFSKKSILHGIRLKCPACGQGKLFRSYLKQHDNCPHCGESFEAIRADDGPAWLTIFIVGHVVITLLLHLEQYQLLSLWLEVAIVVLTVVISALVVLPRSKGFFIASIWLSHKRK